LTSGLHDDDDDDDDADVAAAERIIIVITCGSTQINARLTASAAAATDEQPQHTAA